MYQSLQYKIFDNNIHTFDFVAVDEKGDVLQQLEDVSDNKERAERVAKLFTENQLPLFSFEEVTSHLIGVLL